MADDYYIRAKITGDASEFKVAMDGAATSAEANTARIKKALDEAKIVAANYAASIKDAQNLLASGFGANPEGGGAEVVNQVKEQLAASEAGFAATKVKIAELQAELKGVPAATTAAASGIGLTEKQLALMATAAESAARQLRTLPAIQEEVANRVNASVNEMAAIRKRADAEAAESAKILAQVQVSLAGVAGAGEARAQAALAAATQAHINALNVQQEVQSRQTAVTAEAAAREELLARATAQSATATAAEAQAQVEAAIAKEGSAVAALKLADAQEATLTGAQKQAAAIENANQIIQRSQTAVAGLQAEAANQTGISAARMETYVQRAAAEVQKANAAIKASQIALGEAITEGNAAAIASMAALQDAAVNAAAVFDGLKGQLADIESTQAAAAAAAAEQASILDVVGEVTASAAERGQNFASIQAEIAASVGKTSTELGGTYVRAAAVAREATAALVRDAERLGPAVQQGIPGADAALATLRSQMQQTRVVADELAATIKLKQLVEQDSTATTQADAIAQAELAIQDKGSAIAALEAEIATRKLAAAQLEAAGSSNEMRVALAEGVGSTQGMIFALSRVLAAIPAVKTALQYAFPLITAIAFIEILAQMVTKLGEAADAFSGFGKEEQERIDDVNHAIEASFAKYISLRDKISESHSIGLTGIPKISSESFEATNKLQTLREHLNSLEGDAKSLQSALDKVDYSKAAKSAVPEISTAATFFKRNVGVQISEKGTYEETNKALRKNADDRRALQDQIDALEVERQAKKYDLAEAAFHKDIELKQQDLERDRNLAVAKAEEAKKNAQELLTDHKISQDEETAQLVAAENDRYAAEQRYAAAHDVLQQRLAAKGETPHLIDTTKDQQKAALDHQRALDDIEIKNARAKNAELKKINEERLTEIRDYAAAVRESAPEGQGARAELAYLQTQQAAIAKLPADKLPEQQKKQEFIGKEIPKLTAESAKETEAEVKKSVNDQYEAWIGGAERTAQDVKKYWTAIRDQYSSTTDASQSNAAVVIEANKRIAESEKQILVEARKVSEELKHQEELRQKGVLDAQKAAIVRKYETTPQTSLNPFALPPQEKEKQELGKVDLQEIQAKQAQVNADIATEEAAGRTSTDNYAKLISKKLELDNQYEAKKAALENEKIKAELQVYLQYYDQITSAFFKGINEWILGQKRFAAAMRDTWKGIVTAVIQDIEKIAAKWIAEHLIMAAIAKLLGVSSSQTTAAAKTIAVNESEVQSYAGLAGATEFAYALAESGGDLGAALAKATAAVAIAESFGPLAAVETGGYIPKQGIAMLHPGEVVVNHPVTSLLSNIAARGGVGAAGDRSGGSTGSSRSSGDVHLHMHNNVSTVDSQGFDRVLETHGRSMIRYFKSQLRDGRLN